MLRKVVFGILFALFCVSRCFAYGSISCAVGDAGSRCFGTAGEATAEGGDTLALSICTRQTGNTCNLAARLDNECVSLAYPSVSKNQMIVGRASTRELAAQYAIAACIRAFNVFSCNTQITLCDQKPSAPAPVVQQQAEPQSVSPAPPEEDHGFNILSDFYRILALLKLSQDVWTGIEFCLGVLVVTVAVAERAAIANFVIHGNLPYKIETRSQDIEILFVRSQRANWYGRAIFGFTAQMGMTDHQLSLVRRYWLGRVVAFDSLRRKRQNEFARLHLQLAAQAEAKPKDDKPLSQFLAFFRTIFFCLFWLFRSLISFLIGFLFIRVNVAKLVRGRLVESADLTLLMEAKTAIEQTSHYLKEYLKLAETFDNREEVYEPPA